MTRSLVLAAVLGCAPAPLSGLASPREDAMPPAGKSPALSAGTYSARKNGYVPAEATATLIQAERPSSPPRGSRMGGTSLLLALDDVGARLVAMEIRLAYLRGVRDLAVYAERVR